MVASLRFWTYFCAFFGVAGLLLSLLAGLGSGVVLGLSLFMGLSAGVIIASLARALNRSQSTSTVGQAELAGRSGEVLVEIAPGRPGKVRLDLGGELLDLPAIADGALALPAGARIVVLSFEGERALVTPEAALLDATPRKEEEHD
jgi:membrane protein implicated in regulation of membrane protease activity